MKRRGLFRIKRMLAIGFVSGTLFQFAGCNLGSFSSNFIDSETVRLVRDTAFFVLDTTVLDNFR